MGQIKINDEMKNLYHPVFYSDDEQCNLKDLSLSLSFSAIALEESFNIIVEFSIFSTKAAYHKCLYLEH